MRTIKILLYLLLFPTFLWAQIPKSFSTDPSIFIKELSLYLNSGQRSDYKQISKEVESLFSSLPIDDQTAIINTSNLMLQRRMASYPYFGNYYSAILAFYKFSPPVEFLQWNQIVDSSTTRNLKPFDDFTKFSFSLFSESELYNSRTIKWKIENNAPYTIFWFEGDAIINFGEVDLACSTSKDSLLIVRTKGSYNVTKNLWVGKSGKTDWSRFGLKSDSLNVELSNYQIDLKYPEYTADSVSLRGKNFEETLIGQFSDRVSTSSADISTFPRFDAYTGIIFIKEIANQVDYLGKFKIEGYRYFALSDENEPATLFFKKNDSVVVKARGAQFLIKSDNIQGEEVEVSIYIENDSIYHPSIYLKYDFKDRYLNLFNPVDVKAIAPFYNSYHQFNIQCDAIGWNLNKPELEFFMTTGLSNATVVFTSANYFSKDEYIKIQGITTYNPIDKLFQYSKMVGSNEFSGPSFAAHLKLPYEAIKDLLLSLSAEGFIIYKRKTNQIIITDKVELFVMGNQKKKDYDVIRFVSKTAKEKNAILDLNSLLLKVKGVPAISMSDTHRVIVYLKDKEVIIGKNRSMQFSGILSAGSVDFNGQGFSFDYDSFSIKLDKVDQMKLKIYTDQLDEKGNKIITTLPTTLEEVSGSFILDDPNNKSASKSNPQYPKFIATSDSKVFFEDPKILSGAYKKDKLAFNIKPFAIDSLDNLASMRSFKFDGKLDAKGIVPDIETQLTMQADSSLGFMVQAPIDGYPIYNGKGTVYGKVSLNNSGLLAGGSLTYQNATLKSESFTITPDSMFSKTSFNLPRPQEGVQVNYPEVIANQVDMFFDPAKDSMSLITIDPAIMFANRSNFTGKLHYSPTGLKAKEGLIVINGNSLSGTNFVFENEKFNARNVKLEMASAIENVIAFEADSMKADVDFNADKGVFKSESSDLIKITMPFNLVKVESPELVWGFSKSEIFIGNPGKFPTPHVFQITNPKSLGLDFVGTHAKYDFKNYELNTEGVEKIVIADASIQPDKEQVTIGKDGVLNRLQEAKIVADTLNQFHNFFNTNVSIISKKKYNADGYYNYKNLSGSEYPLYFNTIYANDTGLTVASASVNADSLLQINEGFSYSGLILLTATEKPFALKGNLILPLLPDSIKPEPFRIEAISDPLKPYIIPSLLQSSVGNLKLYSGFFYNKTSRTVYPLIMGRKISALDSVVFNTTGTILYDSKSSSYQIGDSARVLGNDLSKDLLTIDTKKQIVYGSGSIDIGMPKDKIGFTMAGTIATNLLDTLPVKINAAAALDLDIPNSIMKLWSNQLLDISFKEQESVTDPTNARMLIHRIFPKKDAASIGDEFVLYGALPSNANLEALIWINNVVLNWDSASRSFKSVGNIGVGLFGEEVINKQLPGIMELREYQQIRTFSFLIEIPKLDYYMLSFRKGLANLISSNMDFNSQVNKSITSKSKKDKVRQGNDVNVGSTSAYTLLKRRFTDDYDPSTEEPEPDVFD